MAPLSRDRSGPYTTQKLNLLTGGTDKLFRGPWQGTVADVIELLNRDYPRVIGCDTETGHSSLLPSRFPSATISLPLTHLSLFTTTSIASCPKHRKYECASLLLLLSLFYFFFFFSSTVPTAYKPVSFFYQPHLHRPQGVWRRNKGWRRSVRKRRISKSLGFFVRLSAAVSKFIQCIRLLVLIKVFTWFSCYCSYYQIIDKPLYMFNLDIFLQV